MSRLTNPHGSFRACQPKLAAATWAAGVIAALGLTAGPARGADAIWTGGGADDLWSSGPNWLAGTPPQTNDGLVFDGTTRLTPLNNLSNLTAGGIQFPATAGGFILGGNGITLGGDIVDRSINPQSIDMNLVLSGQRTVSVLGGLPPAGGALTINGIVSGAGGLTLVNNALNRVQTGNGGVLSLGSLTLTHANTYTGPTVVESGNLILDFSATGAPAANIVSNQSALVLGRGVTSPAGPGVGWLTVRGGGSANNAQTFAGTTVAKGANYINVVQNGAANVDLSLAALTRNAGGVLSLTLPSVGSVAASAPLTNGIIGGWATVGNDATTPASGPSDWATIVDGKIVPLPAAQYTEVTGAPTIVSNAASNVKWVASSGDATVGAGTTDINTFLYDAATARNVNINASGILRFGASGGILRPQPGGTTNLNFTGGRVTAGGAPNTPGELVLNNGQLTTSNNNNGTLQIASIIQDNGTGKLTLIKTGRGSATINGNNTYTGDTYILEGRISLGNANGLGAAGTNVYIEPGGHLFVNTATPAAHNYFIAGLGSTENAGQFGAIRLNNAQTFGGTVTLTGAARVASNGANGTFTAKFTGGFDLEFLGVGDNGLTISNVANDWAGETTINRGTLRLGNDEVIPHGAGKGNLTINGGAGLGSILDLNGKNETINALTSRGTESNAFVQNGVVGTTSTLTVGANDASGTFGGVLRNNAGTGGTLALTKVGTGVQTLTGTNAHTGPTSVQGGTLRAGSDAALSAGSAIVLGAGASSGVLDLNGFNPTVAGLSVSGTGTNNVVGSSSTSAPSVLTVAGGTGTFAGSIRDSVTGGNQTVGLTLSAGSLTLSGANTYTGATTLNGGTLSVTGSLSPAGAVTVNPVATLIGSGDGVTTGKLGLVTLAGGSLRPGTSAADGSIGTLTLAGLTANAGDIRFGLVALGNNDRINVTGTATFGPGVTVTPTKPVTGTHTLVTAGELTGSAPTLNAPTGTRSTFALQFDEALDQIRLVVTGDPKTLTWTGANGPAWDLTTQNWSDNGGVTTNEKFFNLDTVIFNNVGAVKNVTLDTVLTPSAVTVNNGAGNDYTISGGGAIADSGFTGGTTLTKAGAGRLTLATTNTYAGATQVQEGTLVLGVNTALPAASAVTLGSGATSGVVDLNGFSVTVGGLATAGTGGAANVIGNGSTSSPATLTVGGGASVFDGTIRDTLPGGNQTVALAVTGGSLTLTGDNTYTGQTTIGAGATLQVGNGGATGSIGAGQVSNDGTLVFNRSGSLTVPNLIFGNGSFQKLGPGTLIMTGDNTFGVTVAVDGGTLQVGNGGTVGSIGNPNVTVAGGAAIFFNRSDDVTYSGVISGAGGLRKGGAGRLTFNANNAYTGDTSIEAGTFVSVLNVNTPFGPVDTGTVTVASGAAIDVGGNTTANNANYGAKQFRIVGTGVGGTGVLTNSSTLNQQNVFQEVTLTGDATVGGTGRFDIRGGTPTLDLAGHTLTKVGTNQFTLVGVEVLDGNMVANEGVFAIETTSQVLDFGTGRTITYNTPAGGGTTAASFFDTRGTVTRPMVVNGNGVELGNASGAAQPSTIASNITLNGNLTLIARNATPGDMVLNGNIGEIGGPRSITKNGVGTHVLGGTNTYTGTTTLNGGTVRVTGSIAGSSEVVVNSGARFEAAASQLVKKLTVNGGATAVVTAGGPVKLLRVGNNSAAAPLTIDSAAGGKLDLAGNAVVVDHAPGNDAASLTAVRALVLTGYNAAAPGAGDWAGNGITSSAAAANASGTGVGYALASEAIGPAGGTYLGAPVDGSSVVARYTLLGDATLDGLVDFNDLVKLAQSYNTTVSATTGSWWYNGDFTYDGVTDFNDLVKLAQNYNTALPTAPVAGAAAGFDADLARAFASVPEPSVTILMLGVAGLAAGRRRRRS